MTATLAEGRDADSLILRPARVRSHVRGVDDARVRGIDGEEVMTRRADKKLSITRRRLLSADECSSGPNGSEPRGMSTI